ncbi:MAG: type III pantothenate kinase [bacterium]|nr:type III pantothenate kinase [bacterium]
MATLVVDSGNSRVKLGLFKEGKLEKVASCAFGSARNMISLWVQENWVGQVFVSDVNGHLEQQDFDFGEAVSLQYLNAKTELPFKNFYLSKATLGADRKALVAGALHFFSGEACLVIDAGTCVTYDVVNASQEYLGGNISPGLHMRLRAMNEFTGKLPLPNWEMPEQVLGQDTQSCLLTGAYFGLIGEMAYFIAHYEQDWPQLKVILTGGDAQLLAKRLKTSIFVDEHLLLYGLNKILTHHAE